MACHHQACIIFPQQAILHSPLPHSALLANLKLRPPGLSHGAGVLPDNLNGADGGSVFFTTTVTPPEKTFLVVAWSFNNGSGDREIITSVSSNVIGSGYENRITFDRSTGSLELRNLTMDDTGEYRIVLTPDGGVQKTGDCRLEIFMSVSNVVVTPSSTDLIEFNSSVSLSCSSSGSPRSYTWLNGSSEVTASEGVQITDGGSTLTIISVTRYDQVPVLCIQSRQSWHQWPIGPENTNMRLSPSQEYHEKGSNISLSCSAGSRPPAQFQWALNRALLSDTGPELRLNNIQMKQSGNYSCQAHNIKTRRYQTSQSSPASITEPSVTPVEGKPVNLTCDAAGSVLTREWRKDGSPVSPGSNIILHDNNRVLSFSPLKRTDSGEYSCTASNPASSAEAKYKMTVNYGPENVKITGPNEIKVKQTLTLICSAESTPTATYIWMKNGTEIHRNSAEFTKSEIELSDGGEYTCQAGNNITGRTATSDVHRLSVGEWVMLDLSNWFGPENTNMTLSPSQEYHEKGSDIILSCSAVSRPPAQFQWALNGAPLSDTGPELRLNNIQMKQSGNYSCQAHNTKTLRYQTSQPSRVTVVSAASITEPPVTPVEGKPVNLTCDAAGSVLTREWRKDGSPVSPGSNIILHDNNRVLSFSPLKRTDSGEYSCTASNPVSSAEAKYKMTVNFGPENVKVTGPNEIKVKQTLTLICSAESTPTATYIWMKNGTEIHTNSAEFTKSEIELSDGGEYTCQAGNNITGRTATSDANLFISSLSRVPSPILALDKSFTNLTCDASGSISTREWMKDGQPLQPGGRVSFSMDNRTVYIEPVQSANHGSYQCRVGNPVIGPYNISINGPAAAPPGRRVILQCTADSVPPATFSWMFNGNETHTNNSLYTIDRMEEVNTGNYTCTARNQVTKLENSTAWSLRGEISLLTN
uniref:Ig-like domain-containing protein n=1 Tax=Myripristis murdjan TaxID=586833 RepID=A0A668A5V2_9TELE